VWSYAVVIPTSGRHGLARLLTALDAGSGLPPEEIVVVDERRRPHARLRLPHTIVPVRTVHAEGRGASAARNLGWREVDADWVVFLGEDVVPAPDWSARLAADLTDLPDDVGGCQGIVNVPLPEDRRPTGWERDTAELARTSWITADMAYRRSALVTGRGFDERFRNAYRGDEDLALRLAAADLRLVQGSRELIQPIRPAGFWAGVRAQAGNADDALMRHVHGPAWRERVNAPASRFVRHLWTCGSAACALAAVGGDLSGRLPGTKGLTAAAALAWAGLTAEFATSRIKPGPRTAGETFRMLVTSVAIPPVSVAYRMSGEILARRARPRLPAAVLFERDGTLIDEATDKGDPGAVVAVPGAREALGRLRDLGVPVGVVTNQPGIAGGVVHPSEVAQVNHRVEALLGPFDVWEVCPHAPADGCACRQPRPGLIRRAAATLGVAPEECVVIGDVAADVTAAHAAGARGILVPTPRTQAEEVGAAAEVAADLVSAVEIVAPRRVR
jgi:histidinol-phosphate phosphatase family protein